LASSAGSGSALVLARAGVKAEVLASSAPGLSLIGGPSEKTPAAAWTAGALAATWPALASTAAGGQRFFGGGKGGEGVGATATATATGPSSKSHLTTGKTITLDGGTSNTVENVM
jgi:hypothetical protein